MYLDIVRSCQCVKISGLLAFLCMLCVWRDVRAASWVSVDKAVFNIAVQTAKYTFSAGVKIVLNNPRIAAAILAIYYRNQIFNFAKDITGSVVGECPYISLLIVLASLSYYSFLSCNNQDNQEQETYDTE